MGSSWNVCSANVKSVWMRSFAMARTLSFIEIFTLLVRGVALMYALRFAVA
jgi:hypothetical protein